MMGVLVGLVVFLEKTGFMSSFDENWIDKQVLGRKGWAGEMVFLGVSVVLASVGFPRQMVSFLGGYAFGLGKGVMLALGGTVGGCIVSFVFARLLARRFVQDRFARKVRRIDDFLHDNPFSMTLLIRLLPAGSNLVTNLAAGVSSVKALPFFLGSALGFIPQTVVFALAGSGVEVDTAFRIGLGAALFLISGILGVYLYRKYRHGKTLGRDIELAIDDPAQDKPEETIDEKAP